MGWGDETLSIPCFLCQNAHEMARIGAELSELFRRERGNITSEGNTCKIFNHELHELHEFTIEKEGMKPEMDIPSDILTTNYTNYTNYSDAEGSLKKNLGYLGYSLLKAFLELVKICKSVVKF